MESKSPQSKWTKCNITIVLLRRPGGNFKISKTMFWILNLISKSMNLLDHLSLSLIIAYVMSLLRARLYCSLTYLPMFHSTVRSYSAVTFVMDGQRTDALVGKCLPAFVENVYKCTKFKGAMSIFTLPRKMSNWFGWVGWRVIGLLDVDIYKAWSLNLEGNIIFAWQHEYDPYHD